MIRTYTSDTVKTDTTRTAIDSLATRTREAMRDSIAYEPRDSIVAIRAGTNRFVWNLRYPGADRLKNTLIDEGTLDGPVAPPGEYTARLILAKDTLVRRFAVVADPRAPGTSAELVQQFTLALAVRDRINDVVVGARQIEDLQSQLDQRTAQSKDQPYAKRVSDATKLLRDKLEAIRAELYEVSCHADECTLDQPVKLYNILITINSQVQTGDYAPTKQHGEMFTDFSTKVADQLSKLAQLESTDLAALNKLLAEVGMPAVWVAPKKGPTA